jgi:hypothetical protein
MRGSRTPGHPLTGSCTTELEDARLGLVRNYAAGFGTNLGVARRIAALWSRRWPLEELAREPEQLQRTSLAEVQAAAQRY